MARWLCFAKSRDIEDIGLIKLWHTFFQGCGNLHEAAHNVLQIDQAVLAESTRIKPAQKEALAMHTGLSMASLRRYSGCLWASACSGRCCINPANGTCVCACNMFSAWAPGLPEPAHLELQQDQMVVCVMFT